MEEASNPIINYFITGAVTLVGVFPLIRWQIAQLISKSEKQDSEIEKLKSDNQDLKLLIKDSENASNKKIIEAFAQSSKEQQSTLITISEQFANALAQVSASNIDNRNHLDRKLVEVHDRIDDVIKGQNAIEKEVSEQIHKLELTVVSTLRQSKQQRDD